jgi:hypothetical protein
MLDEDLPLEAGLGIDSIKTVEIFSKLKPYHPYFQRPDQDEEEMLKRFTRLKTLRDIINAYDEYGQLQNSSSVGALAAPAAISEGHAAVSVAPSKSAVVHRFELEPVETPLLNGEKKKVLSIT